MKKYILYIGLLQVLLNFNSYGKNIEPKTGALYTNFNRVLFSNEFHNNGNSYTQVGTVKIENNILSVNFSVSWSIPQILTGPTIPFGQTVPNTPKYYYAAASGNTGYWFRVENNQLKFGYDSAGQYPPSLTSCYASYSICLPVNWYRDFDGDSYGDDTNTISACSPTAGYVANNTDCNDNNALYNNPSSVWYRDADGDGFGNAAISIVCGAIGYVQNNTDCNDNSATIAIAKTWYIDADNDGFGETSTQINCIQPPGYVNNNLDSCPGINGTIMGCIVPNTSAGTSSALSSDQNYTISITPKVAVTSLQNVTNSDDLSIKMTYYDGLGRPIQQIDHRQSNASKDIVTHIEYDTFGRQTREYLPYASPSQNNLNFTPPETLKQLTIGYYQSNYATANPYTEKEFEGTPTGREIKEATPGADWAMGSGHETKTEYSANDVNEVILYTAIATTSVSGENNTTLTNSGFYEKYDLYKTIVKNENWTSTDGNNNTIEEFKDKEGRLILKRLYDSNTAHDNYYVYDQYGNLTFVLPPLASDPINQLDALCFQYKYDYRNRMIAKKLPGKTWEFTVYDKLDRVVAVGPTLSPFSDLTGIGWVITKYDTFNRPILSAWQPSAAITTASAKTIQDSRLLDTVVNETKLTTTTNTTVNAVPFRYTNIAYPPTTTYHVLTLNYYDDYNFTNAPTVFTNVLTQPVFYNNTVKPKGLPTGSWVRDITTSTSGAGESSYLLYDYKNRPVRTYTKNYLGGFTQTDTKFDFAGKTNYTVTTHNRSTTTSATQTITDTYTYNAQDRLQSHKQIVNTNTEELIADNTYDDLGQLIIKKVGNKAADPLQKIDYAYNVRGWLTEINKTGDNPTINPYPLNILGDPNDLFAFKINYNTVQNEPNYIGKPLYNGNIAETYWRTSGDNQLRKYGYYYDHLNRLKDAIYQRPEADAVSNMYNETITYDKNGNISTLNRNGDFDALSQLPIPIDNLTYGYNGNQLLWVKENSNNNGVLGFKDGVYATANTTSNPDYTYDAFGNMISDKNKGITSIKYNHQNLPTEIIFTPTKKIAYNYTALGNKIKKTVTSGTSVTITDYLGGYQYLKEGTAAVALKFFPHAEGYVNFDAGVYKHVFNYQDHIGNVRMSFTKNGTTGVAEAMEESHYYPFGLKHTSYNVSVMKLRGSNLLPAIENPYKYRYNGKEFQNELGLNVYNYGFRNYMPDIGRWMSADPLLNDLDFKFDPNDVDKDNDDEVVSAIQTTLGNGGGIFNTDNLNPYSYGYNDPVRFDDPDGRCPPCLVGLVILAVMVPELAVAPTKNPAADAKGVGNAIAIRNDALGMVLTPIGGGSKVVTTVVSAVVKKKASAEVKKQVEKVASKYENVTNSSRGKPSTTNIKTDVTKKQFEKNLKKDGFEKSVSKDGKVTNYSKNGSQYTVRDNAKSTKGATADFKKDATSQKVDVKIRLE